jgi:hypothetical protein
MTANYTYSHTIDNGNFTTFINLPPNQFDYASERGNSNQDLRNHLVANFTATAPEHSFLRGTSNSAALSPCSPAGPSPCSPGKIRLATLLA